MPSPFPGMDPYLEGPGWPDFHFSFIFCWRDALNLVLPKGYRARIDERINLIELDGEPAQLRKPDVAVAHVDGSNPSPTSLNQSAAVATIDPISIPLPQYEEVREARIEIIDRPDNTLVAVLELLSPYNKESGEGQGQYLVKRDELLRQKVHLVELDLLLDGLRLPFARPLPAGDYFAMISRAERRPMCDVYAWGMRDPLPRIPVPLRTGDPDVMLDLASIFAVAFASGRYDEDINYLQPPPIPVSSRDRDWIAHQVAIAKHLA